MNLEFLLSLRFRMLLGSLLLMLALFALVTVNTTRILYSVAQEHLAASIHQISQTLNMAIAPNTTREGLQTLNTYLQELVSSNETGIVYLAITGERGRVIVRTESTPDPVPTSSTDLDEQIQTGVVHVKQPILVGEAGVGTLHFGLATVLYRSAIHRIIEKNAQLLILTLLGVLLTLLWMHIRINQRITRLMQASLALAHGDYSLRAPEGGYDELSRLAQRFNLMANAVQERIEALECSRAEIRELNLNLEKRVEERTLELAETVEHLKKTQETLVQSKKLASLGSVVAAVAHELNTPIGNALTVATAFSKKTMTFQQEAKQGLRRSTLDHYTQDSLMAADLIERNIARAAELITSFKQVAVDQTSSQRRRFNLRETLSEVLSTLRPTFKSSPHRLELNTPEDIFLDSFPGPLGQVVTNFVNNALLHAFDPERPGTMTINGTVIDKDRVMLEFSDNGKGIAPEHLKRIYDPFFTTRLGAGGSGLGLHIVHNIVTGLLGGQIHVSSTLAVGTTFQVILPMTAPYSDREE